jgi:hypothetical protein
MGADQGRAQRWHDTDHGIARGKPLRANRFRVPRSEPQRPVSACWCCCVRCDPDFAAERMNPYWSRARAELSVA